MIDYTPSTLVLDFGGVISKTLFETHPSTEKALGLAPGSLTWRGPFDPRTDRLWCEMQADECSERDYWLSRSREVGKMIGQEWTKMSDLLVASRGERPNEIIRPEFLRLLKDAKNQGYKIAILSNELDLFYGADFRNRLDFLPHIDLIHDATYTMTLKPDPAAYLDLVSELGVEPEECIFVDDQIRNIIGARSVGMKPIHFDVLNPGRSFADVARILRLTEKETS